ncbi:MAG: peptide-methionine (S)-S-oxide reductase MsrA [Clostridiales bacterium]|nr:peptide-methionine (S)-S-oxide reductase MsrA [Clostridiales bacterium]
MNKKEIYLAGGCFWGLQKYMDTEVKGVIETEVGYANGHLDDVKYNDLHKMETGFCETVKVVYDSDVIPLSELLEEYYYTIDPTSINRQGVDVGSQYRTGIYYTDESEKETIEASLLNLQKRYAEKVVVECLPLTKYITAELYHQKYLDKNPRGYCHINFNKIRTLKAAVIDPSLYTRKSRQELKETLTPLQFAVTQENESESPFENEYWDKFDDGIYVDITTGEPLFSSKDKYDAGDGYASFKKPIDPNAIEEFPDVFDEDLTMQAISRVGRAFLGHIYDEPGGKKRYSINSASLRFIPSADIDKEGYGYIKNYI